MVNASVALVTGASSGIGLAVVGRLARGGYRVWAGYRNCGKLAGIAALVDEGLSVFPIRLDVDQSADVRRAVAAVHAAEGRLDVLVNNAGFVMAGFWEDQSDRDLKAQFETHVFAVARMCREVVPIMRERGEGTIVNIGSASSVLVLPVLGPYSASKAAVDALTESLRFECRPFGIRVMEVLPGETRTGIVGSTRRAARALSPESPNTPYSRAFERLAGPRMASGVDPDHVAEVVWSAVRSAHPRRRYYVNWDSRALSILKTILPACLWELLIVKVLDWDAVARERPE